jgi:hypothetical protein
MAIDTLAYVKKLEAAGVARPQAEAHAQAARELVEHNAATKADLDALGHRLDLKMSVMEGRLNLLTWMVGFTLAGVVALLIKLLQ